MIQTILDMLHKQVEVATEDYWDAKMILKNHYDNWEDDERLIKAAAALDEACRIRDKYIMDNIL